MEEGKYDGVLISMLQDGKSYESLFDNLFGFLRRKTDFFSDWKKAETIIASAGKTHIEQYMKDKKDEERKKDEKAKREATKGKPAEKKAETSEDEIMRKIQKAKEEQERVAREEALKKAAQQTSADVAKEDGDKKDDEPESKAPPGNGGITDRYIWTQTLHEVNVQIPILDNVTKKDLEISMTQEGLKVGLKGQKAIIEGVWPEKVDV